MKPEPKPCACGSKNWVSWMCCSPDKKKTVGYYIECEDCGEATNVYRTEEDAIEAWNKEVGDYDG